MRKLTAGFLLVVLIGLLSACGDPTATSTTVPTKATTATATTTAATSATATTASSSSIQVSGAYLNSSAVVADSGSPAPAGTTMAGMGGAITTNPDVATQGGVFLTITNTGSTPDTLLSVQTPIAARAELHNMAMANGANKMVLQDNVPVPANSTVNLAPGGLHIMVFNFTQTLKAGQKVPLTLKFEKAGSITIQAEVRKSGA